MEKLSLVSRSASTSSTDTSNQIEPSRSSISASVIEPMMKFVCGLWKFVSPSSMLMTASLAVVASVR
jgi:hypothetical protein